GAWRFSMAGWRFSMAGWRFSRRAWGISMTGWGFSTVGWRFPMPLNYIPYRGIAEFGNFGDARVNPLEIPRRSRSCSCTPQPSCRLY
ncbi:hypothetical protein EV401DRAFT_1992449, partial [Pisolithus croceorrhizus]